MKLTELQSKISKDQLLALASDGSSYASIGKSFGLNESQMKRLLLSYQIIADPDHSKLPKFLSKVSKDDLINYLDNASANCIAKEMGVSKSTIEQAMLFYGITITPSDVGRKSRETKKNFTDEQKEAYYNKLRLATTKRWANLNSSQRQEILDKAINTKRLHNTFNTSEPEEYFYSYLCGVYGSDDIVRQYKCDRYPFKCDFYVKSKDLFFELNLFWLHNDHPFDITNREDIMQMEALFEKASEKDIFRKKLATWIDTDVVKFETAILNKLKYIVIYENSVYSTIDQIPLGRYSDLMWINISNI